MTEAEQEWKEGKRPGVLLPVIDGQLSNRKLRLFACACCRSMCEKIDHRRSLSRVERTEAFADGIISASEFNVQFPAQGQMRDASDPPNSLNTATRLLGWQERAQVPLERPAYNPAADRFAYGVSEGHALRVVIILAAAAGMLREANVRSANQRSKRSLYSYGRVQEELIQSHILRDIRGNPFHSVVFNPDWLTSDVVAIARGMYETRDFAAMPILADALQDAGCENADILDHCRGPGRHVRGCWVVDLVLGKE